MKLIVGLGNPGGEYLGTRHNVGFEVINQFAEAHKIDIKKRDFKAIYAETNLHNEKVILLKPMTYMNLSGESVGAVCRRFKIEPADVWLIVDDINLPLGKIRLRFKGSPGGHNGLKSIEQHLHTNEYPRIRIGVGASVPGQLIGHVLGRFSKDEAPEISASLKLAVECLDYSLLNGFELAMNRYNS